MTSLLVWTTTPWTLPSNQFAAVHPEIEYATVLVKREEAASSEAEKLILAKDLVEAIAEKAKCEFEVVSHLYWQEFDWQAICPPI